MRGFKSGPTSGIWMMEVFQPDLSGTSYEDHTADIWLVGRGDTPEIVLSHMLNGLYGAIADRFRIKEGGRTAIDLEAGSLDLIMVDLISEGLFLLEGEGKILTDPQVSIIDSDGFKLTLAARECSFEIPRGDEGLEIKAVAYHGAYLKPSGDGWEGRVLLDI